MALQPTRLINVRVDADTAAEIERRVKVTGSNLSTVVRDLIVSGLGKEAIQHDRTHMSRHRADLLERLADLAALLRRLGNLHAYALKSRQPVGELEARARVEALDSISAAAREIARK